MGKNTLSALSLTDSLLLLDSVIPGGASPSKLADDIFNDPLSWQGPDPAEEVAKEIEKEKRSTNRETSILLDKSLTGLLSLTPQGPEFKLKSLKGSHRSAPKPIKLSLNGDNMHVWDDEPSRRSTRTPKELGKELNKRMTRLFTGFRSTFPSPISKPSPLDAPVSATSPYTPPAVAVSTQRFSLHSPGIGVSASATWNILQFYTPHLGKSDDAPKTAGLPSKPPRSARLKVPPPLPKLPPAPPSAPAKKKTFPTVALPPTPMRTSTAASSAKLPPTPMRTSSTATLTPSTAALNTSTTLVSTPLTATSSIKSARRPLPLIPSLPTPTASPAGASSQRSNTIPRLPSTPISAQPPVRAKSEVHPKRRMLPMAHPPIPDNAVELVRKHST